MAKAKTQVDEVKQALREQYKALYGINPIAVWSVAQLKDKIEAHPKLITTEKEIEDELADEPTASEALPPKIETKIETKVEPELNTQKYKELPPPVVAHLQQTFGAWLNYFEIGQEYKQDFGGYGMYIKVPKEFSSEYRVEEWPVHDNVTRSQKIDPKTGLPLTKRVVVEDIRWKSLRDLADVNKWINLVKEHIVKACYNKGIQLPNTNAPLDETKKTYDQYKQSIHT